MNKANILTTIRMILVLPFFIFAVLANYFKTETYQNINKGLWLLIVAGIIFIIAMITDWLDGYFARKNNQITSFGKLFDPIADKIIIMTSLIMLFSLGFVPVWIIIILVIRDVVVDGSRNVAAKNNVQIAASIWGKIKTFLLSLAILIIIFIAPTFTKSQDVKSWFTKDVDLKLWILNIPIFLGTIVAIVSGVGYFKIIIPYIKTKKRK